MSAKPRIAITMGDPSGIGPEIARHAAADPRVLAVCDPILYGPAPGERFPIGMVDPASGRAAYDAVERAVADACAGRVEAVATAPINKYAWSRAGIPWTGHTELIAHLSGAPRVAMMFWSEPLKVVLATIHVPLRAVPAALTRRVLDDTLALAAEGLARFGVPQPRLALAGLNPHAGEDGLLGDEEQRLLRPSVEAACAAGLRVSGPIPGDTVFVRAVRGEFDAVVACYHDQGLIPVKLVAFGRAVNVTLGLPILRTSVDHGTAFDIAGKNLADPSSMIEAVLVAARFAPVRGQVLHPYSC